MNNKNEFRYLSEGEGINSTFITIPKALYELPSYRKLSNDAIMLYGILLDRFKLSIVNNIKDNYGRVYVVATIEGVMKLLNVCKQKARKIFKELMDNNLIKGERINGFNKTRRLYLGGITFNENNENKSINKQGNKQINKDSNKSPIGDEKHPYEGVKYIPTKGQNTSPNNTNINNTNLNKYKKKKKESFGNSEHNYCYLQEFNFED